MRAGHKKNAIWPLYFFSLPTIHFCLKSKGRSKDEGGSLREDGKIAISFFFPLARFNRAKNGFRRIYHYLFIFLPFVLRCVRLLKSESTFLLHRKKAPKIEISHLGLSSDLRMYAFSTCANDVTVTQWISFPGSLNNAWKKGIHDFFLFSNRWWRSLDSNVVRSHESKWTRPGWRKRE